MGRRNQHSADEFHELVMSAVEMHLTKQPANALSMRKLAQSIGYAPSMLVAVYHNYATLLLHVNARTLDEMYQVVNIEPQRTPTDTLHLIGQRYLDFALTQGDRWQLVFDHKMPDGQTVPDWMQEKINMLFDKVAQQLAFISPNAEPEQIALTARTLWSSVHGITQLAVNDKLFTEAEDGREMIHSLLHHFLSSWTQNHKE